MKKLLTAALCAAMLVGVVPASVADSEYPELTLDSASPIVIAEDGYVDCTTDGMTAAELLANFRDRSNVTLTAKDGTVLSLTDKIGSDAVVSYVSGDRTAKTWSVGDTNGDAGITTKDVSFLVKDQAGFSVDFCRRASDVNGDGTVNAKDVAQLMKYLAGWSVELAKPAAKGEVAPDEDAGIGLYFTTIMNRIPREDVDTSYGSPDYIYRMAKNETETAEIMLTSDADREGMTLEVGALTNENGAALETEVLYGYYYDIALFNYAAGKDYQNTTGGYHVDPLVPLTDAFALGKDQSMTFAVVIKAASDAQAGFYKAPVLVKDADGKTVKQATLRVYVWDFALDEKMSVESSFGLNYGAIYGDFCGGDIGNMNSPEYYAHYNEVVEKWYEFLLDHDVSAYDLPYDPNSEAAQKYVHDPRVTSFICAGGRNALPEGMTFKDVANMFIAHKDDPDWLHKAYVYTVDEPYQEFQFAFLEEQWAALNEYLPDIEFNVCTPLASNWYNANDPDSLDLAERMARSTNILCPQSPAFVEYRTKAEREAEPEKYPAYQGDGFTPAFTYRKWGQFADRYEKWREEGKRMWWYICCSPEFPYANFFNYYQGVNARMVLWQQYLFHVDGLLYWDTTFWQLGENDSTPISRRRTNGGDGMLIYPGSLFGMPGEPITSIRFESVRDGFEDYRYMKQLEAILGRDAVLEYVRRNTDAILHYTEDPDDVTSVRSEMGFLLESFANN